MIGQIESEPAARRFSDFLYVQKISNQVEPGDAGRWAVWVHHDDDLVRASQWLALFRANPNDPQFGVASRAEDIRRDEAADLKDFQKRVRTRRQIFPKLAAMGFAPMTALLMSISILVAILSRLGSNNETVHYLFFADPLRFFEHPMLLNWRDALFASDEIRSGQIWRLFTPIFLHFGILHIVFNMYALRDLGYVLENREGVWRFSFMVLIIAAVSNWAQYVFGGHPMFGGMSGVIYGLFGYAWMKSKFDPNAGFYLHPSTVRVVLIWYVLCFTGLLGHIANAAHTAGLVAGVIWGYLGSKLR